MNEIKQSAQNNEESGARTVFWGTIALAVITLLVSAYFFKALLAETRTPVIYFGMAFFLSGIAVMVGSIVLTVRGRQEQAVKLTLTMLVILGMAAIGLFEGRGVTASLTIFVISVITLRSLFPSHARRNYAILVAISLIFMWTIEWISPPWRLQVQAASVGPIGAAVFAVLSVALAARQAWGGNIRVKIITAFTVVAVTSLGILGTVTYVNYRNQVREDIRQRLLNIISITALQQDGDLFTIIQTADDMQSDEYQQMQSTNAAILATDRDLAYIFSVRVDEQGKMIFVVDSGLEEGYVPLNVGVVYDDPSALLAENALTLDRPIVEEDFYTDEYGAFLSAYAPIYDQDGTRVGIVGVDIFADKVIAKERAVLLLILVTTLVAMVLVTLLGLFLGNTFTKPIINLSLVAHQVAEGNLGARANVETTDEIGELAKAFNAMTSQLQGTLQGLEQRIADRTRNLELAAEVGRSVSQVRALDVMLKDAAELIRSQFDLYYVQVYLTDASQTNLLLLSGTGKVGEQLVGRSHRLPLNTSSINGRAASGKKSVIIADTSMSATFRPNPLLPNTRSEMAIPLVVGDRVVGVLDLQSEKANALSQELLPAFEALAGQVAIAIQNANLLAEAEQARVEVEKQARRLVQANWADYMDAIHKPEETGYVFEQNKVMPLTQVTQTEAAPGAAKGNSLAALIEVTGEAVGNLVVEMEGESSIARSDELVETIARQVAQHIEGLRLLESAERYRFEAEEASRRLTRQGWKTFVENTEENLGYFYDLKEVRPHAGNGHDESAVALPLKVRDEVMGKLAIQGLDANDSQSLELASAVAERLSAHVESLRQSEETKRGQVELDRRARQLAAVAEISTASSRELDIQKMLEAVVNLTQRKFGQYHAHIFTFDEMTAELQIAACGWNEGNEHEGTHETSSIPLDKEQSLVARAARTRQAVIVNDVRSENGWLANPLLPDTASEMAVPLVVGDQVLGVLDVQSDRLNAFTEEDANIHTTLASQVATALQNARSFEQAQRQADQESMLNTIGQKIQSATSVEAVLQIAARELGRALGAPLTVAQLGVSTQAGGSNGNGH